MKYIVNLKDKEGSQSAIVGGKNASLGEMIHHLSEEGIRVPQGFATTIHAYQDFIAQNKLDKKIAKILAKPFKNIRALNKASHQIRQLILNTPFSPEFTKAILLAYKKFHQGAVAVRSSATAEDLAHASFAGQQETFLNVRGAKNLLHSIKLVYASLFTSRAIAYRSDIQLDHDSIGISVGIQPMVRSDQAASGVIFTLDTESGFDQVILINASYGLGEGLVQGKVNPDQFYVSKHSLRQNKFPILQRQLGEKNIKMIYAKGKNPKQFIKIIPVKQADRIRYCLTDKEVTELARLALIIEKHYRQPMDIEWAKDGVNGKLYILQARPETVKSLKHDTQVIERYILSNKGKVLASGESIGQKVGIGMAKVILDPKNIHTIQPGCVLVTDMTDPDWEPIMKKSAAIVTNRGGRTCHAAIIARELGIPAIVGCGDATKKIKSNQFVTVSCAEGQTGYTYEGKADCKVERISIKDMPPLKVKICLNLGNPNLAFATQFLPNSGVGLARIEFIISNMIGVHPNALLKFKTLKKTLQQKISHKIAAYKSPVEFYVEKMREGISMIAAAFYPKPVIFRFSDFKTNEYLNLLGGEIFEPKEENPMLGFRGASRYYADAFRECFKLECIAIKRVRESMGLTNAMVMIPFVRTVDELRAVVDLLEKFGLKRGEEGLQVYMMCEIPSNALLAAEFLPHIDGFSIGSNDLTQLTLGLDRDSSLVASLFDERNQAIKQLLHQAIAECNKHKKYVGICGQGPSDHPDFAEWLMKEGIQAISLNPDTVIQTWLMLAQKA